MRYTARTDDELVLGRQGENGAVSIAFPVSAYEKEYGAGGEFTLLHQRAEDTEPYPCSFVRSGDELVWTVSNADNAQDGLGELELRYLKNSMLCKREHWRTRTLPALEEPTDTPPAAFQSWVDEVTAAGAAALDAKEAIEGMGVRAHTAAAASVTKLVDAQGNVTLDFGLVSGADGECDVHIGSDEPTDPERKLWIIPDGTADAVPKAYQSGDIHFTVKVNQYTFRNETASTAADAYNTIDVPAVLRLPESYSAMGRKVPLILICHGAGYGVSATQWGAFSSNYENDNAPFHDMLSRFVAAGYAIADVNGYNAAQPNQTWGCPRAVQAYRKLYEYVTNNYNIDKRVYIYGFSMGGLVALNYCFNNRDTVRCLGLGAPVTGLYNQCWHSSYGAANHWRESSAAAFDFTGTDSVSWQYTSAELNESELACWNANAQWTAGHDPHTRIRQIDSAKVLLSPLPPMKVWQGTADTVFQNDENTQNFVNAARVSGQYAFLRKVAGGSHGISFGTNTNVVNEIIYWFNRWADDEILR